MDELSNQSEDNIAGGETSAFSGEGEAGIEDKIDWVARAIEYEATPERQRVPLKKGEFIESLRDAENKPIPRSTYYDVMSREEQVDAINKLCLNRAKKRFPNVVDKLGQKAEDGDNASIGQFMDYVMEKAKKTETEFKGAIKVKHEISNDEFESIGKLIAGN